MNHEIESQNKPTVLEGEIIAPEASAGHQESHGHTKIHVVNLPWYGKIIAILVFLAVFSAAILLAAGALIIMIPVAIIGALWGWWRLRKLKG
jgi:hypothetical protein